jgi:hypothetical protein
LIKERKGEMGGKEEKETSRKSTREERKRKYLSRETTTSKVCLRGRVASGEAVANRLTVTGKCWQGQLEVSARAIEVYT